ncbi:MAG: hypothetical protein J7513_05955 [Solirubrobacteraceae bacterium]|nr:hypothetical protein [Solirubrobacteraceae bacterium]
MTRAEPAVESGVADRTLWIVAANLGIVALACAQSLSGGARLPVVLALGVLAMALVVLLAARSGARAARSGALARLLAGGLVAAAALVVLVLGREAVGWRPVVLAATAFAGLALVLRWVVAAVEAADADDVPWQQLAAGAPPSAEPRLRHAAGAALGALLLLLAAVGAARYAFDRTDGGLPAAGFVGGVVIVAALMALVAGPLAFVARLRARQAWAERERGRQRQEVAAHLHDEVLQTLALIQRSVEDPKRVHHLARQQERGLRAWLAGRDTPAEDSVAAALRAVAAEVEDETSGAASIEVIVVGDAALTGGGEALAQAARETLRNAARHAGGLVRVVIDPDADRGELVVFIRDDGPGFAVDAVPAERRGVRDAIIGRMEHAGGSASIDSGPDGTEVTLRVPLGGAR